MRIFRRLMTAIRFADALPRRIASIEERLAAVDASLQSLRERAETLEGRARENIAWWSELSAANQGVQQQLAQANARIDATHAHLARLAGLEQLAQLEHRVAQLADETRRDAAALRGQLGGYAAAIDRAAAAQPAAAATVPASAAALEEGFYPLLESFFRGSEEDVEARLSAYHPWVDAMPPGPVADIGCGRGEWLGILGRWGRTGVGVDSNAVVVAELRSKGLQVELADALRWLGAQEDASFAGVTAFHLVEHLPFAVLLRLLVEAHRVLVPGGLLIVETPNPENIDVATRTFWLDPTHIRPLPVELVELAARYCGLATEAVLRLHPPEGGGAARDYALVARKAAA